MILEVIPGGAFVENTYLIQGKESGELIIIDPGSQIEEIEASAAGINFNTLYIVNTHSHLDHAYGVEYFKKKYDAKFYIHKNEETILDAMINASIRFGLEEFANPVIPKIDFYLEDNQEVNMAGVVFTCILVPGHSPGSLCFLFEPSKNLNEDLKENIVICGDTVFAGSVGRVDLTGGTSMEELVGNINKRLMSLPDTTRLFPGHGPETLVSIEKQSNPYLAGFYNEF